MSDPYIDDVVLSIACGGPEGSDIVVDYAERHAITSAVEYTPALEAGGYDFWLPIHAATGNIVEISGNMDDFAFGYYNLFATLEWRGMLTSTTGVQPIIQKFWDGAPIDPDSPDMLYEHWWFGVRDGVLCFRGWRDGFFELRGVAAVPAAELVSLAVARYYTTGGTPRYAFAINGVIDDGIFIDDPGVPNNAYDTGPYIKLIIGGNDLSEISEPDPEGPYVAHAYADLFFTDLVRFTTVARFTDEASYTPEWHECGGEEPTFGFWQDLVRTRQAENPP